MKKLFIVFLFIIPSVTFAQSEWEVPKTPQEKAEAAKKAVDDAKKAAKAAKKAKKAAKEAAKNDADNQKRLQNAKDEMQQEKAPKRGLFDGNDNNNNVADDDSDNDSENKKNKKLLVDAKYLDGAVPVDKDGRVEWTMDIDLPGKSADQIYDITYKFCDKLTSGSDQITGSRIALVNKKEHTVVAVVKEWMIFQNAFLALDRTQFDYTLIAKCSDGHLSLSMSRISYDYEKDRPTGFSVNAEEWITDKYGMNRKHTNVSKMSGKFRMKTIDRKNDLFKILSDALK